MHDQTSKNHLPRGRPRLAAEIVDRILTLAREGWARKAIATECKVSEITVARVCHASGFFFPRGGDRRSEEARAARREAPAGVFDKRVDVPTAASWAGSAYENRRLKSEYRWQKELPRTLKKTLVLAQV